MVRPPLLGYAAGASTFSQSASRGRTTASGRRQLAMMYCATEPAYPLLAEGCVGWQGRGGDNQYMARVERIHGAATTMRPMDEKQGLGVSRSQALKTPPRDSTEKKKFAPLGISSGRGVLSQYPSSPPSGYALHGLAHFPVARRGSTQHSAESLVTVHSCCLPKCGTGPPRQGPPFPEQIFLGKDKAALEQHPTARAVTPCPTTRRKRCSIRVAAPLPGTLLCAARITMAASISSARFNSSSPTRSAGASVLSAYNCSW